MRKLYYGTAYYYEYLPYDRLEKDVEMLLRAGINVVRIAESTWSTLEPQDGVFDFTAVDRVIETMSEAGIDVIVGTPTYAVPTWLVQAHPSVLATTKNGRNKYGPRQNMDITDPQYLFHAERIIRMLIEHVHRHPAVIGFQIDNETKHYGTAGEHVQKRFVEHCRERFGSTDEMNRAFGLDYWSNRINAWEDFPSIDATINASLSCEFSAFQRQLVNEFLSWQASLVNEYKRDDQFITHNFDFDWRDYSYGVQPDVNHFEAAAAVDIAGVDIYHPSQDSLSGCEISFCGDIARCMKGDNYFVIETEAQGHAGWLPYPGQLRLQAFSHLASGANMVSYWHYHSIHNSYETYWKGLLSHDFQTNPTYEESVTIGRDFQRLGSKLADLKVENKTALLVSNIALSSFNWFDYYMGMDYNDYVRRMYDSLYNLNVGCDIVDPSHDDFDCYDLIVVPPLYAAEDELLRRLNRFVYQGGHVVYGLRSGFSDEHVKVRHSVQPGIIAKACGVEYSQFTEASDTKLTSGGSLEGWIELLNPVSAETIDSYDHPHWGKYSAVTRNRYGRGNATYIGCFPDETTMLNIVRDAVKTAGLWTNSQAVGFPLITKSGINGEGKRIRYFFNYSSEPIRISPELAGGEELLSGKKLRENEDIILEAWGVAIIEQQS